MEADELRCMPGKRGLRRCCISAARCGYYGMGAVCARVRVGVQQSGEERIKQHGGWRRGDRKQSWRRVCPADAAAVDSRS